ncbi:MAG: N-acetylmuramoyl-L-alanine amidase [Sarcina sp.]
MKIGLKAGHTLRGKGTGAVGLVKETDKNREVFSRLTAMLKEKGHTVVNCTVDESIDDTRESVVIANKQTLDLFIDIHLNSFTDPKANGVEVFSLNTSGKSHEFAIKAQKELVKEMNWYDRGKKQANFYTLKNTTAPAIYLELGFVTNKNDMDKWNTERICKAIFKAITGNEYISNIPPADKEIYRVRKTWTDVASQKGAFSDLSNAKKCADENTGYSVFDSKGNKVYGGKVIAVGSRVKIIGTHYATGQAISEWAKKQEHTVQEIKDDRALLKEITSWCFIKDLV